MGDKRTLQKAITTIEARIETLHHTIGETLHQIDGRFNQITQTQDELKQSMKTLMEMFAQDKRDREKELEAGEGSTMKKKSAQEQLHKKLLATTISFQRVQKMGNEKEKIFIQARSGDAGGFRYSEFYTIDMRKGQVSECPYALLADSGMNSMVSLGPFIYMVGGLSPEEIMVNTKPPHSKCTKKGLYQKCMSYLDLANDNGDGWKQAPCLSEGPSPSPAVVAFGGKIYLFHKCRQSKTAEVFCPISNKWETLLPPPSVGFFDIFYSSSAVADSQNNRILVHFDSIASVFAYYPADNQWELVLESFGWSSKVVFVDGVIYFNLPENPAFFAAFHVATKQWLNIVFTAELPDRMWRYEYDAMMYLGSDLMCLADYPLPKTHVRLAKFRFERSTQNPADLLITTLPEETYPIVCCWVNSFLPI